MDSPIRREIPTDTASGPGPAPADASSPAGQTDTETLITVFHELQKTNLGLTAVLDRLTTMGRQSPPRQSEKEEFWKAYMQLADQFDDLLQKRYADDLGTSVVFAGLFSAISTAFIIQIQPEFQPDPNATTQALLLLLLRNMSADAIPSVQISSPAGPATSVVVAQGLLYLSLACTLFSALFAFCAKQWFRHYDSAGTRGTIEHRGMERQCKLDGLRRWKCDIIMETFPLLLPLALLLFATALSIYLWTIHRGLAAISVGVTSLGIILYTSMILSSLIHPYSPFQTVQAYLLKHILHKILPTPLRRTFYTLPLSILQLLHTLRAWLNSLPLLLPRFNGEELTIHPPIFNDIPPISRELDAILWALETTLDPIITEAAAAVVLNVQLPVNLNCEASLNRLSEVFKGCFDGNVVREGMGDRALLCIRAFGYLDSTHSAEGSELWTFPHQEIRGGREELKSAVAYFQLRSHRVDCSKLDPMPWWVLTVLPGQVSEKDLRIVLQHLRPVSCSDNLPFIFANFLFFVNSAFLRPHPRDLRIMDKEKYCVFLTTNLFNNLAKRAALELRPCLDCSLFSSLVKEILTKILAFKDMIDYVGYPYYPGHDIQCRDAVYQLCSVQGLGVSAVTLALQVLRLNQKQGLPAKSQLNILNHGARWLYSSLEQLGVSQTRTVDAVGDFLQVLLGLMPSPDKPGPDGLRTIIWAMESDVGGGRTQSFASLLLCSAPDWFEDNVLQQILLEHSIWPLLGICKDVVAYIALGDKLSQCETTKWKEVISEDVVGWLTKIPRVLDICRNQNGRETSNLFCSVLSRVWDADWEGVEELGDEEKTLAMSFAVLATTWDLADFSDLKNIHEIVRLLPCTIEVAFSARIVGDDKRRQLVDRSQRFRATAIACLGDKIVRAAERAIRAAITQDKLNILESAAQILSRLAVKINGELKDGITPSNHWDGGELSYWNSLSAEFKQDIDHLRNLVESAEAESRK